MEKTELLLRMTEHPQKYSQRQWEEILEDEECRQLYALLAKAKSTVAAHENDSRLTEEEMEKEWKRLDGEYPVKARAVAIWRKAAAASVGVLLVSGIAIATISTGFFGFRSTSGHPSVANDEKGARTIAVADTARRDTVAEPQTKLFDNVPLETILAELSSRYRIDVVYRSEELKQLRLFFEWKSSYSIEKVVEMLNHFKTLHFRLEGNRLMVEPQSIAEP
ncbi:MAG: DUF4974 domain-containing protein [Prevotellaceae bacterium]|nr:DUF4974 domain-containing protein [Prevotella sp.]MDD7257446.1 DUF4974 domain-containing protein [Prevotellaceae bacterium]MDY6129824.1 DUF4974 domain-containing protein [Prevotella sp.]